MKQRLYVKGILKVLVAILIIGAGGMTGQRVQAEEVEYTEGVLTYKLDTDTGEASVRDCDETAVSAVIPETILYNGVSYRVTSIAWAAFSQCVNLTEVEIPSSVTRIGCNAFNRCSSLIQVELPDNLVLLDDGAFSNCTSLKSINIPSGITEIMQYTFFECSSLEEVVIPDGVTSIGTYAFYHCNSVTTITLPDSIQSIGESAFYECSSVTTLNIPSKLESIGKYAFYGCSSWAGELILPSGITSVPQYCFYGCSKLTSITIASGVTEIEDYAFNGCSSVTRFGIPDSLIHIGDFAFSECSSVTGFDIPSGVMHIGMGAFCGCSSLTSMVDIPEHLEYFGSQMYAKCSGLTGEVEIPSFLTEIPESMFLECSGITGIRFPEHITSIGNSAFMGCESLTSIDIPDGVTSIGNFAFNDCMGLTSITIPDSVTSIGYQAFGFCYKLKSVRLSPNITSIPIRAFICCYALEELILSNSVTSAGVSAFDYCFSLCLFYPEHLADSIADVDVSPKCAYTINDNNTASVTILSGDTDLISLPESIYGIPISSVSFAEGVSVPFLCRYHYVDSWTRFDNETHYGNCSICGGDIEGTHDFGDGHTACECGYVPFTLVSQKENITLEPGYIAGAALSVAATPKLGMEILTYQWYENGTAIQGAVTGTYTVPTGKTAGVYTYFCRVSSGGYSQDSESAVITVAAAKTVGDITLVDPEKQSLQKGDYFLDAKGQAIYRVTKTGKNAEVAYVKPIKTVNKVTVPATVKAGGVSYKVTAIEKNAFKNNKSLSEVAIGKNVKNIGANAFYKCTKLKKITIKTTKLKAKTVGSKAFQGIYSKAVIKVPKTKLAAYKTLLRKRGAGKKAVFKK
ncbi:MAG: leucine-rich repeat protein [Lachnospiraceae bacterium]